MHVFWGASRAASVPMHCINLSQREPVRKGGPLLEPCCDVAAGFRLPPGGTPAPAPPPGCPSSRATPSAVTTVGG